ncbi:MAG: GNAT family N-acetyltransferase [Chloroflexi bacterium]|nr:GNAT family N-acetyltransferase [Chloroflexota bacterium]
MKTCQLSFRPAAVEDFVACLAIDHSYQTNRIWQMVVSQPPANQPIETIGVRFQTLRLPKTTTIPYPHDQEELPKRWWRADWFLVGEQQEQIHAYATATLEALRPAAWISDLAVAPSQRRQGHGSQLIAAAVHWARQENIRHLLAALPMKNDPAMTFLRKNGFFFCGYNEAHFKQHDIELYFCLKL